MRRGTVSDCVRMKYSLKILQYYCVIQKDMSQSIKQIQIDDIETFFVKYQYLKKAGQRIIEASPCRHKFRNSFIYFTSFSPKTRNSQKIIKKIPITIIGSDKHFVSQKVHKKIKNAIDR